MKKLIIELQYKALKHLNSFRWFIYMIFHWRITHSEKFKLAKKGIELLAEFIAISMINELVPVCNCILKNECHSHGKPWCHEGCDQYLGKPANSFSARPGLDGWRHGSDQFE